MIIKNLTISQTIGNSDYLIFSNNHQYLCFNSLNGSSVFFFENGKIKVEGDLKSALEYLFTMCWNQINSKNETHWLQIFDYIKINLSRGEMEYLKSNPPEIFFEIKKIVEKEILRKIKLKAFW